mgnify:CR=1 FL=1
MDQKELFKDNLRDTHWIGEVVDNVDPNKLGRCRIKVFGKFDLLETQDIPWAIPSNTMIHGSFAVPNIGDIVGVRFDNGNVYQPTYSFQLRTNDSLKTEVLDIEQSAEKVISIMYDAEKNVRAFYSPTDGFIMTTGASKSASPMIRLTNDGKVFINAKDIFIADGFADSSEPAVKGATLASVLRNMLNFITTHIHPTPLGPSGPALPPASIDATVLSSQLAANVGDGKIQQKS